MKLLRVAFAAIVLLSFAACQQMDPTEFGVKFRRLPPILGGGVSESIVRPGETVLLMPWDSIYRFDTKPKDVSWGSSAAERSSDSVEAGMVYSRASDGNEVAMAFTVRYKVSTDPEKLVRLVETTATSIDQVRDVVIAVGRSDIRRYMNELHTSAFLDATLRYKAVDNVREAMRKLLEPNGIEIVQVNLDNYLFERIKKDGSADPSYQTRLTEIQQLTENTVREQSRVETIKAQKEREINAAEAMKNQLAAEADGYYEQAKVRGDNYLLTRENEAKAILAKGKAEAQGIIEQINALSGAGGEALLKLEIAKQLRKSNPKFVVLGHGKGGGGLDVNRIDSNRLIDQIGVLEGLKDEDTRASLKKVKPTDENSDSKEK